MFVELCAGLASVSGVLQHGSTWKPPISRMGRKTGYAEAILRVMGLRPRQGAACYLWAEADSDVAALLAAYTQPEVMRAIADTIRSWIPCPVKCGGDSACLRCKGTGRWDARDLWETLRREKRRGLWEGFDASAVAAYATVGSWCREVRANGGTSGFWGPDDTKVDAERPGIADRFYRAALPWPPVLIAQDAAVEPGDVAGWLVACKGSYQEKGIDYGIGWPEDRAATPTQGAHEGAVTWCARHSDRLVGRWPPVHLTPDAAIQPAQIPPGTVVYIDPPYLDTTGYKHDFGRAEVIAAYHRWVNAGARVYISEAVPIEIPGAHHVEIGGERKGQKRTFGDTKEWLTCSHPPAWTPPRQGCLW